ncbi:MAG: putative integral rane protein [Solirubrobacteraceae bacterium]|nr:putative integral rane protein [Solirubrobacteraceae bacterium]
MALSLRPRRSVQHRAWAWSDPLTRTLAVAAVVGTGGIVGTEVMRVWRRGSAPMPHEADDVLAAAGQATRETVAVAVEGFRGGSLRENALLSLLLTFNSCWLLVRVSTHTIRRRGTFGPFRNAQIGRTHVHHFVPGIVLMMLAGGCSIVSRDERLDPLLAVPFGVGAALTLDESALLLTLDDVYWSEQGVLSVQITLAISAVASAIAIATRVFRRGEREVLEPIGGSD